MSLVVCARSRGCVPNGRATEGSQGYGQVPWPRWRVQVSDVGKHKGAIRSPCCSISFKASLRYFALWIFRTGYFELRMAETNLLPSFPIGLVVCESPSPANRRSAKEPSLACVRECAGCVSDNFSGLCPWVRPAGTSASAGWSVEKAKGAESNVANTAQFVRRRRALIQQAKPVTDSCLNTDGDERGLSSSTRAGGGGCSSRLARLCVPATRPMDWRLVVVRVRVRVRVWGRRQARGDRRQARRSKSKTFRRWSERSGAARQCSRVRGRTTGRSAAVKPRCAAQRPAPPTAAAPVCSVPAYVLLSLAARWAGLAG